MSVTFFIEQERTGWIHECGCGAVSSAAPFESYVDAYATAGLTTPCEDEYCAMYSPFVKGVPTAADELEINVSNLNARSILLDLGFEDEELCGSATGEDLLGRVLLAQALAGADAGMPELREGNFIQCARPEGYFDARFAQIADLANWAKAHDAKVAWS